MCLPELVAGEAASTGALTGSLMRYFLRRVPQSKRWWRLETELKEDGVISESEAGEAVRTGALTGKLVSLCLMQHSLPDAGSLDAIFLSESASCEEVVEIRDGAEGRRCDIGVRV